MRGLPFDLRFELGGKRVLLVHGSPRKVNEYLFEDKPAKTFERIAARSRLRRARLRPHPQALDPRLRRRPFVNCGSVGKPKDGDPRGGFAILEAEARRASRRGSSASSTTPSTPRARSPTPGLPGEYAEKLLIAA